MTEERKTYLQEVEAHGADNGWVAPLTEEGQNGHDHRSHRHRDPRRSRHDGAALLRKRAGEISKSDEISKRGAR